MDRDLSAKCSPKVELVKYNKASFKQITHMSLKAPIFTPVAGSDPLLHGDVMLQS